MPIFNVLFPVFFLVGIGYFLGRKMKVEPRQLSKLTLFVLSPALMFSSLSKTHIPQHNIILIISFTVLLSVALWGVGWLAARFVNSAPEQTAAVVLASIFMNSANYGLPVVLFALGKAAFNAMIIMVVTESVLVNSFGAFLASRGKQSWKKSLTAPLRLPSLYAVLLATLARVLHVAIPLSFARSVSLLGHAAIPVLLLLLGVQLSRVQAGHATARLLWTATALRLLISPLIAVALLAIMHVQGILYWALLFEAAMPAAVNITVLAIEFDAGPEVTASVTFLTTILSVFSLGFLLYLHA